jgi:phosphatidylinositol-4,5-bisphosphate 4-phosphatase
MLQRRLRIHDTKPTSEIASKPTQTVHQEDPVSIHQGALAPAADREAGRILQMQSTVGNQAVMRSLQQQKMSGMAARPQHGHRPIGAIQRVYTVPSGQGVTDVKVLIAKRFWYVAAVNMLRDRMNQDPNNQGIIEKFRKYVIQQNETTQAIENLKRGRNETSVTDEKEMKQLYPKKLPGEIAYDIKHSLGLKLKVSKSTLRNYFIRALNNAQDWGPIVKTVELSGGDYTSTITPVNENFHENYGEYGKDYGQTGLNSMSTSNRLTDMSDKERNRTTNLAHTQLENAQGKVLFSAFRSGALSGKDVKGRNRSKQVTRANTIELLEAMAIQKLKEMPSQQRELYFAGTVLPMNVLSMSLQSRTKILGGEKKHVDEQLAMLAELNGQDLAMDIVWSFPNTAFPERQVRITVKPHIIGMNFGVNSQGTRLSQGNSEAIKELGVAVGQYRQLTDRRIEELRSERVWQSDENLKKISEIRIKNQKIDELWALVQKGKGSVASYKQAARIANLAYLIEYMVHFNCKSGKDRTGLMDAESKYLAYQMEQKSDKYMKGDRRGPKNFVPQHTLQTPQEQEDFQKMVFESGSLEMQQYNTGGQGYKIAPLVGKPLPGAGTVNDIRLRQRLGGDSILKQVQGLKRYTDIDKI